MSHETVGSLLAVIANSLNDGLRIMMFADKRAWGSDEFEQLRLLEETLDEAKKDFQELPALVNGRYYYENDRIGTSSIPPFPSTKSPIRNSLHTYRYLHATYLFL